jgi:acetate kinase
MSSQVLVLNSGSSSIKFSLFDEDNGELDVLNKGQIAGLGTNTLFTIKSQDDKESIKLNEVTDHASALKYLLDWIKSRLNSNKKLIVGHRVVHGGSKFYSPAIIDSEIIAELKKLETIAPLHQPFNLSAIEALMFIDDEIPQVACFDTAFHTKHDKINNQFALPNHFYDEGVRRYGFHGLSYEYIVTKLKEIDGLLSEGKVIVAHLGNGSSVCALDQCKSIDSSMGFSALDGLMMGTRCGSIDAGVILYLLEEKNMKPEEISDLLYKRSGLLGVSEVTNDMSVLLHSTEPTAREAIDLYVHCIVREAGSMIAILKGLDGLIFTAGIGENASEIRSLVCNQLNWLGVKIDEKANQENRTLISTEDSFIKVYVIPTNEELMIAKHTIEILSKEDNTPLNLQAGT